MCGYYPSTFILGFVGTFVLEHNSTISKAEISILPSYACLIDRMKQSKSENTVLYYQIETENLLIKLPLNASVETYIRLIKLRYSTSSCALPGLVCT